MYHIRYSRLAILPCHSEPFRCHSEPFRCHSEPFRCHSERSEESVPKTIRACAQRRRSSRVSAHKTTILHENISSLTFPFRLCRRRQHPVWQRPREDRRYAPVTLNIRSRWHHRGAYLHKNVEICAADPRYTLSTASSGCISPLESQAAANE